MNRQAFVRWEGGLRNGRGAITTDSGVIAKTEYSFNTRLESQVGLGPEELLAAAQAACFSMALVKELDALTINPDSIQTNVTVTFIKQQERLTITNIDLDVRARIPGIERFQFDKAVNHAREHSPMLMLLNVGSRMSVSAHLSAL